MTANPSGPSEECIVCHRPDCPDKITEAEQDARVCGQHERACDATDCHVLAPQDRMVLLFRECWYCPEHAVEELRAAARERRLSRDEKATFRQLTGAMAPRRRPQAAPSSGGFP